MASAREGNWETALASVPRQTAEAYCGAWPPVVKSSSRMCGRLWHAGHGPVSGHPSDGETTHP